MPPSWTPPDINIMPGESCIQEGLSYHTPRARDFPNPHDGEMKSDPSEKLYETPTKKTMGLIKWVDWDFSEIQSITLSYNKNN